MERGVASEESVEAPASWFYPNHIGKLVVFGLVGGYLFCAFWAYRSWQAYAANAGYSRRTFWNDVRRATGYRPSPFWRAVLLPYYQLCLFPAVNRECRVRGVRGVPAAELLALAFAVLARFGDQSTEFVERALLSPVWAVVPVQLAVNRLHRAEGRRLRLETDGWELLWVLVGLLALWGALK
jgi:hypothetical protein